MVKIGLKKISFAQKGMVSDSFFDKTGTYLPQHIYKNFSEIAFVQDTAILSDETSVNENGSIHTINIDFSIRRDFIQNNDFISMFVGRPIIVMVEAVDGEKYVIGSNHSPAFVSKKSIYNGLTLRELQLSIEYLSIEGLQVVDDFENIPDTPAIVLSQETVIVPTEGGSGIILVDSQQEWNVEVTK